MSAPDRMPSLGSMTSPDHARELDAQDPLAPFRERFLPADGVIAHLDGNSLGRPLVVTDERMQSFITRRGGLG